MVVGTLAEKEGLDVNLAKLGRVLTECADATVVVACASSIATRLRAALKRRGHRVALARKSQRVCVLLRN
jgi:hypothetical protein